MGPVKTSTPAGVQAYLERYPELGGPVERVALTRTPFTIGRADDADHKVYSSKVSKLHAEIVTVEGALVIRDLQSTNGTFVNGRRTAEHVLQDGDVIQLAHVEFCFRDPARRVARGCTPAPGDFERTEILLTDESGGILHGAELLDELIATRAVASVYQPIVDLRTRRIFGYEALARGRHPRLSESPALLLRLAEQCGREVELSHLFARLAVARSTTLPPGRLFVNLHPRHFASPSLMDSLGELAAIAVTNHPIVIEIAESSVTDVRAMARHRDAFGRLGLEFAYDDFGAGQARFIELAEVPPDYLKLDMAIVRGLDGAPTRRDMVGALLEAVSRLGVRVIAEGIESERVAGACEALGCHLGQGYLFGPPA